MNLGFTEMAFIFFVALIIFGPKKLPEIGRQLGKALNEFKRASNEFKAQIESEINNLETEVREHTPSPHILPPAEPPQGEVQSRTAEDFHEIAGREGVPSGSEEMPHVTGEKPPVTEEMPPASSDQLTSKAPNA
jgi:TatA/E family protein of Tat protein translocase